MYSLIIKRKTKNQSWLVIGRHQNWGWKHLPESDILVLVALGWLDNAISSQYHFAKQFYDHSILTTAHRAGVLIRVSSRLREVVWLAQGHPAHKKQVKRTNQKDLDQQTTGSK